MKGKHQYPVYFFKSDTTGEKDFEEFYIDGEKLDMDRFNTIGVIKNELNYDEEKLNHFTTEIDKLKTSGSWDRKVLIDLFNWMIPEFNHKETGKFLDSRM